MATYTLNMWHHSHYQGYHTHCTGNITPTLFMTSHSPYVWHMCALYKTSYPHFFTSNHHFEDITPTVLEIVSILSVSSHQIYRWYHRHYVYDIAYSIGETLFPLYLWHRITYVWHHKPVCWLCHTRPMYDIICGTKDVTSTLSNQATIFMTSHPLQAWHHTPCIRHRTNFIFVITTFPLISHPFLYDITPTICVTTYALYITSYPQLMSSHYCT